MSWKGFPHVADAIKLQQCCNMQQPALHKNQWQNHKLFHQLHMSIYPLQQHTINISRICTCKHSGFTLTLQSREKELTVGQSDPMLPCSGKTLPLNSKTYPRSVCSLNLQGDSWTVSKQCRLWGLHCKSTGSCCSTNQNVLHSIWILEQSASCQC